MKPSGVYNTVPLADEQNGIKKQSQNNPGLARSPYETASSLSRLFYFWVNPLISLGYQQPLEEKDIQWVPRDFCAKESLKTFYKYWEAEVDACKGKLQKSGEPVLPSALIAMYKSLWFDFFCCVCSFTPALGIMIFQPYLVNDILTILGGNQNDLLLGIHNGIALAVLIGVLSLINAVLLSSAMYFLSKASFNMRSAVVAAVFQKSLRLSSRSKSKHTLGEMLTMITSDPERIWLCCIVTNWGYGGFLLVAASIILLIIEVGVSAVVAGAVIAILAVVFHFYITEQIGKARGRQLKFAGERVKATNEVLQVQLI